MLPNDIRHLTVVVAVKGAVSVFLWCAMVMMMMMYYCDASLFCITMPYHCVIVLHTTHPAHKLKRAHCLSMCRRPSGPRCAIVSVSITRRADILLLIPSCHDSPLPSLFFASVIHKSCLSVHLAFFCLLNNAIVECGWGLHSLLAQFLFFPAHASSSHPSLFQLPFVTPHPSLLTPHSSTL